MFYPFGAETSESGFYRRQILTSNVCPRTKRDKCDILCTYINVESGVISLPTKILQILRHDNQSSVAYINKLSM